MRIAAVLACALALLTPVGTLAQNNAIEVQPLDDPDQGSSPGTLTPGQTDPGTYTPQIDGDFLDEYDDGIRFESAEPEPEPVQPGATAPGGAVLRALDTMSGEARDLRIAPGELVDFGRLTIQMAECRYPEDNPEGDAFAYVVVLERGDANPSFSGWMVASSPALNALDHARYDVWVLRCILPQSEGEGSEEASGN